MTTLRTAAVRLVLFAVLWWAITEGKGSAAIYGVIAVPLATATSLWLLEPINRGRSLLRRIPIMLRLIRWFAWQSIRGGADVARRALRWKVDVDPEIIEVEVRVENQLARVLLADICCLTPGSLAVDVTDDGLRLHALHSELSIGDQARELDALLTALFDPDDEDEVSRT